MRCRSLCAHTREGLGDLGIGTAEAVGQFLAELGAIRIAHDLLTQEWLGTRIPEGALSSSGASYRNET